MTAVTGKLVVIEGLEGAGKSTAISTVTHFLAKHRIQSITTREPGGTQIGELLRTIIKNPDYQNVLDDRSELLMLYAARVQLIEEVIKPALNKGIWVIADRFELSTLAYQGGGRGIDLHFLKQLSAFSLRGFKPDLTLYLDINPELGMQRARTRGSFDRIEAQAIDFFHKVHKAYIQEVHADPDAIIIDASQSLDTVQTSIDVALNNFIKVQGL